MKNTKNLHPITQIILKSASIFEELGFTVAEGPEVESDWYNFEALNFPKDHPARDMQDTFWLKQPESEPEADSLSKGLKIKDKGLLLRTHTSPVQIRYIEQKLKEGIEPPYRIIVPGKVFRNEATDATHEAQFHQIEGLYVDKNVSLAHLKGTLAFWFRKLFGDKVEIRFRPSFFPFTEPSMEVDAKIGNKWVEMGGSGLVHPNVLRNAGLDPKKWQGFAFGVGDRLAMVKWGIPDIRLFYGGDLRFLKQF